MLSRISFAGLYLIDILLAYVLTEDYIVTAVTAAVIPVILFIWQKVTLFKSGATHISKCRRGGCGTTVCSLSRSRGEGKNMWL